MLESARKKLRTLIKLIEKGEQHVVYTDFEDDIGESLRLRGQPRHGEPLIVEAPDKAKRFRQDRRILARGMLTSLQYFRTVNGW